MNRSTVNRILDIQEQLQSELPLLAEYEYCQTAFLEMLSQLSGDQQNILLDYLGVCVEIHLRLLELACGPKHEK